jgi:hypothetical protein
MSLAMYEAQQHHGATSRGLCIPDTGIHRARLQLAAEMLVEHDVSDVLDLGCGFGELADLLNVNVRYIGVIRRYGSWRWHASAVVADGSCSPRRSIISSRAGAHGMRRWWRSVCW